MAFGASSDSMYGSGLLHGWVKEADGTVHDLDAIMSGSGDPEFDTNEILGDDEVKLALNSNQRVNLSLTANAFSFDAYAAMTGNPVTDVAAVVGPPAVPAYKHMPGGTLAENNAPFIELGLVTLGKDNADNDVHYVRVFHRVQVKPIKTQQGNGSELNMEFDATAYPTSVNIEGDALASRRIDTKYVFDGTWDPSNTVLFPA